MKPFVSAMLCLGLAFVSTAMAADGDAPYLEALAKEGAAPQAYVLRQFEHADLVLLGEDHAIAQNLAFVRDLIPQLHRAGIGNLVMEFGAQEDQRELDRLLAARHPQRWMPRYAMVTFTRMPYATAFARGAAQASILRDAIAGHASTASIDLAALDARIAATQEPFDAAPQRAV